MTDSQHTTRERIRKRLRQRAMSPSELAREFDKPPVAIIRDVEHIGQSVAAAEEQLLVAPPQCRDCGFDGYDEPANVPSRCPECHSEAIDEPVFRID